MLCKILLSLQSTNADFKSDAIDATLIDMITNSYQLQSNRTHWNQKSEFIAHFKLNLAPHWEPWKISPSPNSHTLTSSESPGKFC